MTKDELIHEFHHAGITADFKAKEPINIHLKNIVGSSVSLLAAGVFKETRNPMLFIMNDREEAAYMSNDLENLVGEDRVFFFPSSSRLPYQIERTDNANVLQRAELLSRLSDTEKHVIVVSYPEALGEKVATRKQLKSNTLEIKVNSELSIDFVNELLFDYHFERVDFVSQPGEFSIRGGIVDIFSYSNDHPYRVEFFGNEVDSIRTFDPANQLSLEQLKKIRIVPNIQDKQLMEQRENFLEFLPKHTAVFMKDESFLKDKLDTEMKRAKKFYSELDDTIRHLEPTELYTTADEMENLLFGRLVIEYGLQFHRKKSKEYVFNHSPQPNFNKNFELLSKTLHENAENDYQNFLVASSAKQIERLHNIFEDLEKVKHFTPMLLSLHEGFIDHERKIACFTDHQIFERYHRFRLKEGFKDSQQQISLKELTQLDKGDYVTHVDHGVGQFAGLTKVDNNGVMQEAIKLIYRDGDVLFVSIHSLHRISKYSGKEGTEPKINKLGTQAWKNLKNKTKKKIKEIAYDLIKLYAERKSVEGFAFSPDSFLQNELEASFIYEDTPDQEKATAAIKEDMESEAPMDRLVCGDVGFGKTEVAIRAAFKAATDGKQVAVLVPTTILALQHYKSFSERLKDFPVRVEYVNRFRTTKETKTVLKDLEDGKVNIIIGTHRLVGKDVKFSDLGLLIIDEEQKFGVGVKDKLKTIKANVDTLTLTATPIPRTLQFSLLGARDLSVINTPPPNRQPVQTEPHTFNEEIIRDAISYEMARDGQVFFINNRVQNLEEIQGMIQRLIPDARVITAHGKLDGKELEDRMLRFIDGEGDVLVATTIIESGLDIPNANTIIVIDAQNFGLSQLHQLRGRVGRALRQSYCYLLIPTQDIKKNAKNKLDSLVRYSDLGSGYFIAQEDLEIRGAGDFLGIKQSGHIEAIGLSMYLSMLKSAVNDLKGIKTEVAIDSEINFNDRALLPDTYMPVANERLKIYRSLNDAKSTTDIHKIFDEIKDRCGKPNDDVLNLVENSKIRVQANALGIRKIYSNKDTALLTFHDSLDDEVYKKLIELIQSGSTGIKLTGTNKLNLDVSDQTNKREAVSALLHQLS